MSRVLATTVAGLARCRDICRGMRNNMRFSNGLQLNVQRLFRRHAREVTYIWDKRFRIACDCTRGEHFGVHEVFTHECYGCIDECHFPENRMSFVDVGANVGAFSVWLAARGLHLDCGIAAELNPTTFERCVRNLRVNGLHTVSAINCAVAGRDGWIDFVPSPDALGDNIYTARPPGGDARATSTRVEMVSLATLLQRHAAGRRLFDLLKLDCEGAEYEILRTTPGEWVRAFRYLVVEFHRPPPGESLEAAFERLRSFGFSSRSGAPGQLPAVVLFSRQ